MAIIPIFIPHAGCPHQCVFCNQRTISGQGVRKGQDSQSDSTQNEQVSCVGYKDAEAAKISSAGNAASKGKNSNSGPLQGAQQQIARWLQLLPANVQHQTAFYGGSFTALPMELQRQLLALTDALYDQGRIDSVRLSTRPDAITTEGVALLKAHNVKIVELGVQSLDDAVLQQAERGHSSSCVAPAVELLHSAGLQVGLQLMVGLPMQDHNSIAATVQQVVALQPDIARIYPVLVIKDTPLARSYARGEYMPLSLEEAVEEAAYMYRELTAAGINVIRIGLQADEELCAPGNIVAGPFHPAMGEMVRSRLWRWQLTEQIEELLAEQGCDAQSVSLHSNGAQAAMISLATTPAAGESFAKAESMAATGKNNSANLTITLTYPRRLTSQIRGQGNCNLHYWQQRWPNIRLQLQEGQDVQAPRLQVIR